MFLAGCGQDRADTPPPSTAVVPDVEPRPATRGPAAPRKRALNPDTRPVLVTYGDSLSAGFGVDAGYSYPDYLQQELDERGLSYRVINAGISGDTTTGGLARIDKVLALKPEVAILELGGNDGLRGVPITRMKANLEEMIMRLKRAGVTVVLAGMTLPPNYGQDYIRQFEQVYVDLARKHQVARIPFLLEGVWDRPGMMQPDGIHASVAGNAEVAKVVMRTLEPALRR